MRAAAWGFGEGHSAAHPLLLLGVDLRLRGGRLLRLVRGKLLVALLRANRRQRKGGKCKEEEAGHAETRGGGTLRT